MNKKELIKILEQVDDDTDIITVSSDCELKGSLVKAYVSIGNYEEKINNFKDDFDETFYSQVVYNYVDIANQNSKKVLIIRG